MTMKAKGAIRCSTWQYARRIALMTYNFIIELHKNPLTSKTNSSLRSF